MGKSYKGLLDLPVHKLILAELTAEGATRGAILVGGAILDEFLSDLIAARLVSPEAAHEVLGAHDKIAGTFSARITLAFALGLITDDERSHLTRVRRIRNDAAHFDREGKGFAVGFSSSSTQDVLNSFTIFMNRQTVESMKKVDRTPERRAEFAAAIFQSFVAEMCNRLIVRAITVGRVDVVPSRTSRQLYGELKQALEQGILEEPDDEPWREKALAAWPDLGEDDIPEGA